MNEPILTPEQWHRLVAELALLIEHNGVTNVKEALITATRTVRGAR